ncbi:MAG: Hsp20/alpha crystallin family protein [Candidatus Geothermarchaeales archaeon]
MSWWRRSTRRFFDEFEELRQEIEEAFEKLALEKPMWDVTERALEPLVEICEREKDVVVMVDLPLVRREDIDLKVGEDSVVINAEMWEGVRFRRWGTHQKDCEFGCLKKHIRLPVDVDPDQTRATFRRGVLKLELAKREKG